MPTHFAIIVILNSSHRDSSHHSYDAQWLFERAIQTVFAMIQSWRPGTDNSTRLPVSFLVNDAICQTWLMNRLVIFQWSLETSKRHKIPPNSHEFNGTFRKCPQNWILLITYSKLIYKWIFDSSFPFNNTNKQHNNIDFYGIRKSFFCNAYRSNLQRYIHVQEVRNSKGEIDKGNEIYSLV